MKTKAKTHFGDYTDAELKKMTTKKLISLVMAFQNEDNFIMMTDSYKMTHHMLYVDGLKEVYSYMEPRGGEMPYTVFCLLQYYMKKYLAGRRITQEKIDEAHEANIAHFGFDCFDSSMWDYILKVHKGRLPLEISAVPEGTPVATKNCLMTIHNTDGDRKGQTAAALVNVTETLLMKLWATNT